MCLFTIDHLSILNLKNNDKQPENGELLTKRLMLEYWFQMITGNSSSYHIIIFSIKLKISFERSYFKRGSPSARPSESNFLELVMIMTWYLGWGDFRAWKTFSEFLVNRCWLNFDIGCLICQNLPKNAKKGNCWLKIRGGL